MLSNIVNMTDACAKKKFFNRDWKHPFELAYSGPRCSDLFDDGSVGCYFQNKHPSALGMMQEGG